MNKAGPKAVMNEIANNKIFTEETITDYMESRGWQKEPVDSALTKWQSFGLHFKYPYNLFELSIVAGDGFYSLPKVKTNEHTAVEMGLLKDDKLAYLKEIREFFNMDIEGYVDWDKFKRIVEFVEILKDNEETLTK